MNLVEAEEVELRAAPTIERRTAAHGPGTRYGASPQNARFLRYFWVTLQKFDANIGLIRGGADDLEGVFRWAEEAARLVTQPPRENPEFELSVTFLTDPERQAVEADGTGFKILNRPAAAAGTPRRFRSRVGSAAAPGRNAPTSSLAAAH
jgi:hypothetical protein